MTNFRCYLLSRCLTLDTMSQLTTTHHITPLPGDSAVIPVSSWSYRSWIIGVVAVAFAEEPGQSECCPALWWRGWTTLTFVPHKTYVGPHRFIDFIDYAGDINCFTHRIDESMLGVVVMVTCKNECWLLLAPFYLMISKFLHSLCPECTSSATSDWSLYRQASVEGVRATEDYYGLD